MIDSTTPQEYLRPSPTPEDAVLAELVGTHAGSSVPFWMLGRVATHGHGTATWAARREGVERWVRRALATIALALAGNIWVGINTMQGRAADAGAAKARAEDQAAEIKELRIDMRAMWSKVTGVDQGPHSGDLMQLPMEFAGVERRAPTCHLTVPPENPLPAS